MLFLLLAATLVGFGLMSGLVIGFALVADHYKQRFREADRERKLLINKAFIRDAQAPLFPAAIVNEGIDTEVDENKPKVGRMKSNFAAGLLKKRAELAEQPKIDAGQKLPDNIKNQIVEAAEKAKAA
jgi:hypothetical protein